MLRESSNTQNTGERSTCETNGTTSSKGTLVSCIACASHNRNTETKQRCCMLCPDISLLYRHTTATASHMAWPNTHGSADAPNTRSHTNTVYALLQSSLLPVAQTTRCSYSSHCTGSWCFKQAATLSILHTQSCMQVATHAWHTACRHASTIKCVACWAWAYAAVAANAAVAVAV